MKTYTLVCPKCTKGWTAESPEGTCNTCGGTAQCRAAYLVLDLKDVSS